jgi:hypothetical protein
MLFFGPGAFVAGVDHTLETAGGVVPVGAVPALAGVEILTLLA